MCVWKRNVRRQQWHNFGWAMVLCQGIGLIGAVLTLASVRGWYNDLRQPAFMPPNWLFAPVWLILYTLLAIVLTMLIIKRPKPAVRDAQRLFLVQLVLNALWTPLFFGWHWIFLACLDIFALWAAIIWLVIQIRPLKPLAAWLLLPYLLWVSLAVCLNVSIWFLN